MCCLSEYERRIAGSIDYQRWLSGSTDTKKAMMSDILQFTNGFFGMSVGLSFSMPQGFESALGLTDPGSGDIMVNGDLFGDSRQFLPLFIFLHELRHGIQKNKAELFPEETALNSSHVIQFDGTCYRIDGETVTTVRLDGAQEYFTELYLGSPAETDANRFAYDMLRRVCDDEALEEHFRLWSPTYKIISEDDMPGEFLKVCERIDVLAEEQKKKTAES